MSLRATTRLATAVCATVMAFLPSLGAGASASGAATQTIRIETPGIEGARCELRNDKGTWTLESTPGMVTVATSSQPLEVRCELQGTGSPLGPTRVTSTKGEGSSSGAVAGAVVGAAAAIALGAAAPMFAPMVAGQLLLPAISIGAGAGGMVDEASRPASYPEAISVPLVGHSRPVDAARLAAARLGIAVRGLTAGETAAAGLAGPGGAIITRTAPGGRADRSGVRVGDIVVACNDAVVSGAAELEAMVRSGEPSEPLTFRIWRGRQLVELVLSNGALPP